MSERKRLERRKMGAVDATPKTLERATPFALVPARHFWSLVVATLLLSESSVAKSGFLAGDGPEDINKDKTPRLADGAENTSTANLASPNSALELTEDKVLGIDADALSTPNVGAKQITNASLKNSLGINLADSLQSDTAISKIEDFVKKWLNSDVTSDLYSHSVESQKSLQSWLIAAAPSSLESKLQDLTDALGQSKDTIRDEGARGLNAISKAREAIKAIFDGELGIDNSSMAEGDAEEIPTQAAGFGFNPAMLLGLAGGGGGGGGGGGAAATSTTTASVTIAGVVVKGYLDGATVWRDANANGVYDAGVDYAVTTNSSGAYSGLGGSGAIYVKGGTDTYGTGQVYAGVLKAPETATVVTPLTTMIQSLKDVGGLTTDEAVTKLISLLGLSSSSVSSADLIATDSISGAISSTSTTDKTKYLSIYAASAQVANLIVAGTAAAKTAAGSTTEVASNAVISALASQLNSTTSGSTVDLSSSTFVNTVLTNVSVGGVTIAAANLSGLSTAISNVNGVVSALSITTDSNSLTTLTSLVQTEYATQLNLSNAITAAGTSTTFSATNFSGTSLTTMFESIANVVGTVSVSTTGGLAAPDRPVIYYSSTSTSTYSSTDSTSKINATKLASTISLDADLPTGAAVGDSIKVFVDGTEVSSLTYTITQADLTLGYHRFTLNSSAISTVFGVSGSQIQSTKLLTTRVDQASGVTGSTSKGLLVTIDNYAKAPSIDLTSGQDSGVTTDKITNTGQTFTITNAEIGASVRVYVGDVLKNTYTASATSFTINKSDIGITSDGTYQISVQQTDVLGNVSATSSAISVVIDTSAPTLSISSLSIDTAISDASAVQTAINAGYINKKAIENGFTLSGAATNAEDGQTVTVTLTKSGASAAAVTLTGVVSNGAYSIIVSASNLSSLSEGSYSLQASVKDVAGNSRTLSSPTTYVVDKTSPSTPSTPDLVAASDSGNSSTDNITNLSSGLSFTGTADVGSSVKLYDNGVALSGVAAVTVGSAGTYSFTGVSLGSGSHLLTAVATDTAGNSSSTSSSLSVAVDQTATVVSSVSSPGDATYERTSLLSFVLTGSEPMYVDTTLGTPQILVTLDSTTTRYANYVSGSGTNALTFQYKVASGDLDTNGIALGALYANSTTNSGVSGDVTSNGAITDAAGNALNLTLNSVASLSGVTVNGAVIGSAVDGYLINVVIFADANHDNQITAGESVGGSIGAGVFSIPGGTGHLIMRGGEDISTGAAFSVQYEAPEGYVVINPVTTLISQYQSLGGGSFNSIKKTFTFTTSNEAAAAKVVGANLFGGYTPAGLSRGVNDVASTTTNYDDFLSVYDSFRVASKVPTTASQLTTFQAEKLAALAYQKNAAMLATLADVGGTVLAAVDGSAGYLTTDSSVKIISAVASMLKNGINGEAVTDINTILTSATNINSSLTSAASSLGLSLTATQVSKLGEVASVIAKANTFISAVDTSAIDGQSSTLYGLSQDTKDAVAALRKIVAVQQVVQGDAADMLERYIVGDTSVSTDVTPTALLGTDASNTSTMLYKVANVIVGPIVPSRFSVSVATSYNGTADSATYAASNSVYEGGSDGTGGTITFKISRGGGLDGTVVLNYQLAGSASLDATRFASGAIPSGSVTFGTDVTEQSITVQLANNTTRNSAELMTLSVTDAGGNSQFTDTSGNLISSGSVRVTLMDDDPNTPIVTGPGVADAAAASSTLLSGLSVEYFNASAQLTATIKATQGVLSLQGTAGATINSLSDVSSGTYTITGTLADINSALGRLLFNGTSGQTAGTVDVSVTPVGRTGVVGTAHIDVGIHNAASIALPTSQSVVAATSSAISGVSVTDIDSANLSVTLSSSAGQILVGSTSGLFVSDSTSGSTQTLVLGGAKADVNTALASLSYKANAGVSTAQISVTASDADSLTTDPTRTLNLSVASAMPSLSVPASAMFKGGFASALPQLTIQDADSTSLRVTVSASSGSLSASAVASLAGVTTVSSTSASVTLVGTVSALKTALSALTYTSPTTGSPSITVTLTDDLTDANALRRVTSSIGVNIIANQAPNAGGNVTISGVTEDTTSAITLTPTTLTDSDSSTPSRVRILSVSGGAVTQSDGSSIVLGDTGTILTLESGAVNLKFTPEANKTSSASFTYALVDSVPVVKDGVSSYTSNSLPSTATINIASVNDATVASLPSTNLSFVENASDLQLLSSISLTDVDSAAETLNRAVISISNAQTGDSLKIVGSLPAGITLETPLTSTSTQIVLVGAQDLTSYQTALKSIYFANASDAISAVQRVVTFELTNPVASGSSGASQLTTFSKSIDVTAVNDAPAVAPSSSTASFTESSSLIKTAVLINPGASLTLTDVDSTSLSSAQFKFTSGYVAGQDLLSATTSNGVVSSFDTASGILTLTGVASIADYQTILRSVVYQNVSSNPSSTNRTIQISVTDDKSASSTVSLSTVVVNPTDDKAIIDLSGADTAGLNTTALFSGGAGSAAVAIAPLATVTDVDSLTFKSFTVSLDTNSNSTGTLELSTAGQTALTAAGLVSIATSTGFTIKTGAAVTFNAMTAGQSITLGGLTYTAAVANTAAQAAAAFASLSNGSTAGVTTYGSFSGTLSGFASGALTSSTAVTFTSTSTQNNFTNFISGSVGVALPSIVVTQDAPVTAFQSVLRGVVFNHSSTVTGAETSIVRTITVSGVDAAGATVDALNVSLSLSTGPFAAVTSVNGISTLVLTGDPKSTSLSVDLSSSVVSVASGRVSVSSLFAAVDIDASTLVSTSLATSLTGTTAANKITGSAYADVIAGGGGADTLIGGAGNDRFLLSKAELLAVASVSGDAGSDTLEISGTGTSAAPVSLSISDLSKATSIEAIKFVGTGVFSFNGSGGSSALAITGGSGDDTITGTSGSDTLIGGGGIDTLAGGEGVDSLTGGSGADIFDFSALTSTGTAPGAYDTVTDLALGDTIRLPGVVKNWLGVVSSGSASSGSAATLDAWVVPAASSGLSSTLYFFTATTDTSPSAVILSSSSANVRGLQFNASTGVLSVGPPPPGTPDLIATSDAGDSSTDNLTNISAPTFNVSLADTGATTSSVLRLYSGATLIAEQLLSAAEIAAGVATVSVGTVVLGSTNTVASTLTSNAVNSITATIQSGSSVSAASSALAVTVDKNSPSISIATNDSQLNSTDTATLSFTLGEASTDFSASDVVVTGGVLSNFAGSGTSYSASFVASSNSTTAATVSVPSGSFRDAAGNNSVASSALSLAVDTLAPTISSVATSGTGLTSGSGSLKSGAVVSFTLTASEIVTIASGTPTLTLSNGGTATYASGSGSAQLVFNYTVPSDAASSSDLSVSAFNINGATLRDSAGNALNTAGALVNPSGVLVIDTVVPTISITTNDSLLGSADTATLTFTLSESATNFTASDVAVTGGVLSNFAGSGTSYTASFVAAANSTTAATVSVAAASFTDAASNSNTASSSFAINVDTVAPTLSSITTGGNAKIASGVGTINSGDTVSFVVNASEAITVTGTPTLVLNNGGTATYVSGSATNALTFNYTVPSSVLASVADLGVSSMGISGATLKDAAGNNLVITNATAYNPAGVLVVAATNNQNPQPVADTASVTVAGDALAVIAQGNLLSNDSDPDLSDTLTISGASAGSLAIANIANVATLTTSATLNGAYGVLVLSASGAYTYTPNARASMGRDDTALTDVFTYLASDSFGARAMSQLTVTINGANNTPVVQTTNVTGAVTELVTSLGSLTSTGAISFTDSDLTDAHTVGSVTPSSGALGVLTPSIASDTTGTGTGGSVAWSYSVAASAVEYLAVGQSKVETFTFNLLDGKGGSVARTVTVTINGTNDAPVLTVNTDNTSPTFESGIGVVGSNPATITTTRSDVDTLDGYPTFVSSSVSPVITTDWVSTGVANLYSRAGNFGTATLNTVTGSVAYQLNQSNVETQALSKSQVDWDRFNLNITDGHVVTTQVAAFKVVGADDSLSWNSAASNTDGSQDIKIYRAEGGRTTVNVDWIATDADSAITYSATLVGTNSSNLLTSSSFALVNNGGQLSGLVSLSDAFIAGDYTLQINANSLDGETVSKSFVAHIDPATQLSGEVLTGSASNSYLRGSSIALNLDGYASYIGGLGNDVFDGAKASQAFAGGTGDDTAIFESSAVSFSSSGQTYLQLSMLPTYKAREMAVNNLVSSEFASAIDPSNAGGNSYAFLSVNTYGGTAYVQAENILISYDLGTGSTTTVAFNIGADSTGRALLNLSGQADKVVAGFLSDNIDAGAGDDVVFGAGNGSSDVLTMPADVILGGAGDDILAAGTWSFDNLLDDAVLDGGQGDDVLVAVSGKVTATGGTGRDVFALYSDRQNVDLFITDFNASVDSIDLSAFTALKNLSQPSQVLASVVQEALGKSTNGVIELDFTQYMGTHDNVNAHAKVTITNPVSSGQLSEQSFIFDKPDWATTNWHINLDPLVQS